MEPAMGVLKVDYNRPLLKKVDKNTGIEVYMYLDLPGVYYNSYEVAVSDALAASAGFDVVKFGKMKKRREQLAIAMEAIDADLEMQEYNEQREVVLEKGGFSVVAIGLGRHIIEDPDGGKLVDRPLTLEEAKAALDKLVASGEPEPKKVVIKSLAAA
jgi:hypothetical protein